MNNSTYNREINEENEFENQAIGNDNAKNSYDFNDNLDCFMSDDEKAPSGSELVQKRKRKTPEEQLALALEKEKAIKLKRQALQSQIDDKNRKIRLQGLHLIGLVIEEIYKRKLPLYVDFDDTNWLIQQKNLLQEKDQEPFIRFVKTLQESK